MVIKQFTNEHNHEVMKAIIQCHPKRRKLDPDTALWATKALMLDAKKAKLAQTIKGETGFIHWAPFHGKLPSQK